MDDVKTATQLLGYLAGEWLYAIHDAARESFAFNRMMTRNRRKAKYQATQPQWVPEPAVKISSLPGGSRSQYGPLR